MPKLDLISCPHHTMFKSQTSRTVCHGMIQIHLLCNSSLWISTAFLTIHRLLQVLEAHYCPTIVAGRALPSLYFVIRLPNRNILSRSSNTSTTPPSNTLSGTDLTNFFPEQQAHFDLNDIDTMILPSTWFETGNLTPPANAIPSELLSKL